VRGNVITRFGTMIPRVFGLVLGSGFGGGGGNIVEGNVVRGSDDDIGIIVDVPNNLITNNVVSDMGSTGIGILIEADGNRIVGNVVSTSNVGISALGGHNHFERNHVEANRSDGLSISTTGYNLVDSNVSEFNGAFGLNFVSGRATPTAITCCATTPPAPSPARRRTRAETSSSAEMVRSHAR